MERWKIIEFVWNLELLKLKILVICNFIFEKYCWKVRELILVWVIYWVCIVLFVIKLKYVYIIVLIFKGK